MKERIMKGNDECRSDQRCSIITQVDDGSKERVASKVLVDGQVEATEQSE